MSEIKLPKSHNERVNTTRRTNMTQITQLTDDNGIVFLDNDERLRNPTNQKTPPPPMWGEVLEEDLYDDSVPFYDHELHMKEKRARKVKEANLKAVRPPSEGHKLKRKVIYVYEKDNSNETANAENKYKSN